MSPGDPGPRLGSVVAVLVCLSMGVSGAAAEPSPLPLTLERPSDGTRTTLSAGPKALHVVFFATWCPACIEELRGLAELESKWAARGYRLVLVSVPARQSRERLSAFVAESHPPGEILFDASGAAQKAFAVDRLPTHVLVDGSGTIVSRAERLADGIAAGVEGLLAGPPRGRSTAR